MKNDIGFRFKILRKSENATQQTFAKDLKISQALLSAIERGDRQPTDQLIKNTCLKKLCDYDWLKHGITINEKNLNNENSNKTKILEIMDFLNEDSLYRLKRYVETLYLVQQELNK